ncbi:phenolic glucoside malonyltransferase 1-like [Senna tora]|uniref:Phenolic glucoside malonyltransferase 1-like n=1 Tax=Senna tora TaxID=362788 RepID=A0A834WIS8_9FABA|nr:phenolic glucoside malonyltransferase 1-like [Senna tora]
MLFGFLILTKPFLRPTPAAAGFKIGSIPGFKDPKSTKSIFVSNIILILLNMASPSPKSTDSSLKILHSCNVSPPSSPTTITTPSSLPFTFFDLFWLRFHPVELLYFYSIPDLHTSLFLDSIFPKLELSLSLTLQHFVPLAGRIIWPSHSSVPIIQYTPGDSISLVVAQSDHSHDFDLLSGKSPREASIARPLIPHLDSSVSSASVFSLQITLFPNRGFCIGISRHHAVFDGKSGDMFMKTWAYLCQTQLETKSSSSSIQKPEPSFGREAIADLNTANLDTVYANMWLQMDPTLNENNKPSLKISDHMFQPILDQSIRATFELRRGDLDKIKTRILEKWEEDQNVNPPRLSTFVLTTAYVSSCVVKAFERTEMKRENFVFGFTVDCRGRLGASGVPENYFGNCVVPRISEEFSEEDGVVMIAKKIQSRIKETLEKGVLEGADTTVSRIFEVLSKGVKNIGVAGSTRFGVYGCDFGWGRPEKVEIASVDRSITIGMTESRDGNGGGVEVTLVLNKNVMDCFASLFYQDMESI